MSKTIRESKRSLEAYKEVNDQKVQQVRLDIDSRNSDMKDLKLKVEGLQKSLDQAHYKHHMNSTQLLLDETKSDLKSKAKIIDKLDHKYEKDEMELKRSLL